MYAVAHCAHGAFPGLSYHVLYRGCFLHPHQAWLIVEGENSACKSAEEAPAVTKPKKGTKAATEDVFPWNDRREKVALTLSEVRLSSRAPS